MLFLFESKGLIKLMGGFDEDNFLTGEYTESECFLVFPAEDFIERGAAFLEDRLIAKQNGGKSEVKEILCIEAKSDAQQYKIIVNLNYDHPIQVSRSKGYWKDFYSIAEGEIIKPWNQKGLIDYFNSNKHNRLYSKADYKLTKILGARNGNVMPMIEIRTITHKTFLTRLNHLKALKKT